MTLKEYWKELNEMYGLGLEMPKEIKMNLTAVAYEMAMGKSFDGASQNDME